MSVGCNRANGLSGKNMPLNSHPHFLVRIATPYTGRTAHFVIDGVAEQSQTLPTISAHMEPILILTILSELCSIMEA
jgi:hypothetical protein